MAELPPNENPTFVSLRPPLVVAMIVGGVALTKKRDISGRVQYRASTVLLPGGTSITSLERYRSWLPPNTRGVH